MNVNKYNVYKLHTRRPRVICAVQLGLTRKEIRISVNKKGGSY